MAEQKIRDWIRKRLCKKNSFNMKISYDMNTGKLSNRLIYNGEAGDPAVILGALDLVIRNLTELMAKEGKLVMVKKPEVEPSYIG